MSLTIARAESLLAEGFSPWVTDLDLRFDAVTPEEVVLRMPFSPRLCRAGGIVCGQAFMALADTASVFGLWADAGEVLPCTTATMATEMMRPVSESDVLARTRVLRRGRTMAFVQVLLQADGEDRPAVNATCTLVLL